MLSACETPFKGLNMEKTNDKKKIIYCDLYPGYEKDRACNFCYLIVFSLGVE